MRIPAILLSLSLALTALTSTASATSSLNLKSGVGYGLAGLAYETTISPNTSVEIGAGYVGAQVNGTNGYSLVVGGKYFFSPLDQGPFVAGRAFFVPVSGVLLGGGTLTGGYRFVFNAIQFDLEAGGALIGATNGSSSETGAGLAVGLGLGYRF
ncbi:hypothetical protein [Deinococcus ruber]|uniref:Outer membrane protein beta-barrel domain-containing protein n=1 Tax=Deinococcus ruber TaxID=1848197 RepID=A0A918CAT7_9DEIO|nr:hypothetical protein [Deinococcus ruber]GGR14745.1 hypothetical protein GCM10008957_29470 [Deinococcus ruber]